MAKAQERSHQDAVAEREKSRVRVSIITAVVITLLMLAPIVYTWGRSARVNAIVARDIAKTAAGAPTTLLPGTPADEYIPQPDWTSYAGGSDYGTRGRQAVVGLVADGRITDVSARYRKEFESAGWVLDRTDETAGMFLFSRPRTSFEADVIFRQVSDAKVSIIVNMRSDD